jgi:redox-sensitive bicupin YhaK (pirin superfamily)
MKAVFDAEQACTAGNTLNTQEMQTLLEKQFSSSIATALVNAVYTAEEADASKSPDAFLAALEARALRFTKEDAKFVSRKHDVLFEAVEQGEGVGARVRRTIGRPEIPVKSFSPFLMLDEFKVRHGSGFTDHPHFGMITSTYMLPGLCKGSVKHEDFLGNKGELAAGDLQWMTAGRGIVHAEMPGSSESAIGMQLWINLKKSDKRCEPSYQELKAAEIPALKLNGVHCSVIAGSALGINSPIRSRTPTSYAHYVMDANSVVNHPVALGWNTVAYVIEGTGFFGPEKTKVGAHHVLTFPSATGSSGVTIRTGAAGPVSFIIVAGEPIDEPIFHHGPFVTNTRQEMVRVFDDMRNNDNKFADFRKNKNFRSDLMEQFMKEFGDKF